MHIYGSCRSQLDPLDWEAVVSSGGSTTTGLTVNIYAQIRTRAGRNLLSAFKNITIASGDKLTLTINEDGIKSGEDAFEIVFSAENTTSSDAAQLATIKLRDSDQITQRTLPINLELTLDSHFALAESIATSDNLPANPVNGQMRQIGADYYEYDNEALSGDYQSGLGYWKQVDQTFNTYLSATNALGGCDYPQSLITGLKFAPPVYPGHGADHTPLTIWLLNGLNEDGQAQLSVAEDIALEVKVNDSIPLASSLTKGIKVRVLGYVRRTTGILNDSIAEAGNIYVWEQEKTLFQLTTPLPRGYAIAVQIILAFRKTQLRGGLTGGEPISTILYTQGKLGTYNPIGFFTGNAIASLDEKMRILPTTGGFKRTSGLAIINNYVTPRLGEEAYPVAIADTADQQIALSGVLAGDAFVYQSGSNIPSSQALRAKFSTVAGEQTPSDWSNSVTLVTGQILQLTIDHPANSEGIASIRGDYPDVLIAGLATDFTAPFFRLFLEVDGIIYQSDSLTLATQTDTQQVTVDSLTGFSIIGSLPSQADSAFGLWNYSSRTLTTTTGSGSLTNGVPIRFALAYAYPSPNLVLTKIAHEGLEEIPYTLIEAITRSGAYTKVRVEGSEQQGRGALNFNDPLFSSSDNSGNDSTDISLPAVRNVYFSTSAPTVNDDGSNGYRQGDRWHHYTGSTLNGSYVCLSAANGSASWPPFGNGGNGTGGHTLVDSQNNSLTQRSKAKFNSAFFTLNDDAPNDQTVIDIGTSISTGAGLAGGGDHSANRTHRVTFANLSPVTQPNNSDIFGIETGDGLQKITWLSLINHPHVTGKGAFLTGNGTQQITFTLPNGKYIVGDSNTESGLAAVDPPNAISTRTTAQYTQPEINGTVIINFGSTANFVANQTYIAIETGGIYQVTAIADANTATAKYIGFGANPTTQVETDRKVSLSGRPGDNGASSITTVSTDFTMPLIGNPETIEVGSSAGINLNSFIDIATAGGFKVTSKDDEATPNTITVENLGGNNTAAGVTISNGSQIVISGSPGPIGSVSATGSVTYSSAIPPPSTGPSEWKNFIDSTNSNKKSIREPNDGNVRVFAFLSDILPTVLTGLSLPLNPTEILPTDTLLESIGKAQKYFTDFLSNFNGANQLLRLGVNGEIPKLDGRNITQNYLCQVTIATVKNGTFRILALPPGTIFKSTRIDGIYDIKSGSNTGTISVRIDGTDITGLDNISIDQTGTDYTSNGSESNKTIDPQQDFEIVLTNGSPTNPMTNLSFSIYGVYNP